MRNNVKSLILLFLAPMIWGFAFVMQCVINTELLGSFTVNAVRFFLGAVTLLPVILIFEREPKNRDKLRKTLAYGALTGTILFVASWLQMYGISLNKSSGKSGFLTGLYIVIVPFLGSIVYKKRVNLTEWLAAAIATVGLFLLSVTDGFGSINIGDVLVFVSAFFWAVHILVLDRLIKDVSPVKFSCMQFFTSSVLNLIFALIFEKITLYGIYVHRIPILYMSVISTGIGFTCQNLGQRDVDPNLASLILSLEGVFSAISGAIFLAEKMTARGYLGCLLMFSGIILSQVGAAKKSKSA